MSRSGGSELVPASLRSPALGPVWAEIRARLDRHGPDYRARVRIGVAGGPEAALVLRSLLDRPGPTIDLAELEVRLVRIGLGSDLDEALGLLGWPSSPSAAARRQSRVQTRQQRERLGQAVTAWPEPWAGAWAVAVAASGALAPLDGEAIERLASGVRRLLDAMDAGFAGLALPARDEQGRVSRVDVAAQVLGSSHALDSRSLVERVCRRALASRLGLDLGDGDLGDPGVGPDDLSAAEVGSGRPGATETEVWERAGFHLDRLSSPIPTWGLDLVEVTPLAELARISTAAGLPLSISAVALTRCRPMGANRSPVLVVENPRVVEAAADTRAPFSVVATNGNPRRNLVGLVTDLLAAGTDVRYHGDFDSAGLAICHRMVGLGCRPWAMDVADYTGACERAAAQGVELPVDPSGCGPTPWDPALAVAFNGAQGRRVVHEELVLAALLAFPG